MKWRIIAVAVSLFHFYYCLYLPVSPADVFSVRALPFLLSVSAVMVRILLQAYRFRYFINHFIGPNYSTTLKTMNARIAGEFVTQTTPSFIGGEIVRIAWLIKNGVPAGKSCLSGYCRNNSRCFCRVFWHSLQEVWLYSVVVSSLVF